MTKNEIVRELRKCNPQNIKSLYVVYHNCSAGVRYCYSYEFTSHASHEILRELACVVLSLWKLRKYVETISVDYFPVDDNDDCECIYRGFSEIRFSRSISDFIKTIKK